MLDKDKVQKAKDFNSMLRYAQGFRATIAGTSTTPVTITLNSSGKKLLGLTINPCSGLLTDIADCQLKLVINNNNLLLNFSALNACPLYVGNMIFLPTPQDLFGNDSITIEVLKNNGGNIDVIFDMFYIPRI